MNGLSMFGEEFSTKGEVDDKEDKSSAIHPQLFQTV